MKVPLFPPKPKVVFTSVGENRIETIYYPDYITDTKAIDERTTLIYTGPGCIVVWGSKTEVDVKIEQFKKDFAKENT